MDKQILYPSGQADFSARVPALVHLGSGHLVLVHDLRPRPKGEQWRSSGGALPDDLPNPNSVVVRHSYNHGSTWDDAQILAEGVARGYSLDGVGCGYSDPSLIWDGSKLHLFITASRLTGLFGAKPALQAPAPGWHETPAAALAKQGDEELALLYGVSEDSGYTWSWRQIDMAAAATNGKRSWRTNFKVAPCGFSVSGHGVCLNGGRLGQPLVLRVEGSSEGAQQMQACCLLSDDGGQSWFLGQPCQQTQAGQTGSLAGGTATSGVDEFCIAQVNADVLLLSARDAGYSGQRLSAVSLNGGVSWTKASPDPVRDPGCNAGMVSVRASEFGLVIVSDQPHVFLMKSELYNTVYCGRHADDRFALLTNAFDARQRRNGWLEAVLLPPGGASGFTEAEEYGLVRYQFLAELEPGSFGYSDVAWTDRTVVVVYESEGGLKQVSLSAGEIRQRVV